MKRLIWSCAAVVVCAMAIGSARVEAQGTACDSPCKIMYLPLIRRNDAPVPNSNPLAELQGKVSSANQAYFEYQVDKPAVIAPGSPQPIYPDSLKVKKVEGEFIASFIVDTTGRVELSTFRVLKPGHPLFIASVRDALPLMRFIPAELAGMKVRQLVQRPFVFSLPH